MTEILRSDVPKNPTPESQAHYDALIAYFKWLVTITLSAMGIIAVAGVGFFFKSLADVRTAAETAIQKTISSADGEVARIRDEAKAVALSEARARISEAFERENVRFMIESEARKRVGPEIDRQVRLEVERTSLSLQAQIDTLGEITDLAMTIVLGHRRGLDTLIHKTKDADQRTRAMALTFLDRTGDRYEKTSTKQVKEGGGRVMDFNLVREVKEKGQNAQELVECVRKNEDLNIVALCFLALREETDTNFRMFDLEAVERWCAQNRNRCK